MFWPDPIVALTPCTAVMITDLEYPYRPAFSLLTKILDEHQPLLSQLPPPNSAASAAANAFGGGSSNPSTAAAGGLPPAQKGKLEATLTQYLTKYQDPKQADTIMKVQKELDETKIVLVSLPLLSWCHRASGHARKMKCLTMWYSTRLSSRFWSVGRSWITLSSDPMPCRPSQRCSTRPQRRYVSTLR